jgi:hypothetical protein
MEIGTFVAKETILSCPKCRAIHPSLDLRRLAPERCRFGFDVMEYVGRAVFLGFHCDADIVQELKTRNIQISVREIAFLGKKFISYLALAHREARDRLRQSMAKRGGYILHLDGTCDGDSPHLVSGFDGLSKLVLNNIKVPSEKSEFIIPFLEDIKRDFGAPLAMVHDMGSGIQKAVNHVFPGIPDYICHFHFLRDIGKDLLESDYGMLRTCLKNNKIRSLLRQRSRTLRDHIALDPAAIADLTASLESGTIALKTANRMPSLAAFVMIQWILDAHHESGGYGFPFDRPHLVFCQRLKIAMTLLKQIKDRHLIEGNLAGSIKAIAPLARLYDFLAEILRNKHIHQAVKALETRVVVFDSLRTAMRIALPETAAGLNDEGEDIDMQTIEQGLIEFRTWIQSENFPFDRSHYTGLLRQLNKYWLKLLAAPITISAPGGKVTVVPQRTNNDMERLFRNIKRGHRKKTGTSQMSRALRALLADTPLITNLKSDEYLTIILDGKVSLAERFAGIEAKMVRQKLAESHAVPDRLPAQLIRLMRRKQITSEIVKMFSKKAA